MSQYANFNGTTTVVELFATLPDYHPDFVAALVECDDTVQIGWSYAGGVFSAQAQTSTQIIATYESAAQVQLDTVAKAWGYDSLLSAVSYASSAVAQYKADAAALVTWRDAYWPAAYAIEAAIKAGTQTLPATPAAFVALLPAAPTRPTV